MWTLTFVRILAVFVQVLVVRAGPDRNVSVGGFYYEFFKESLKWHDAERNCQRRGMHLATIISEEQDQVLWEIFKNTTNLNYAHIGLTDTSGPWRWIDNRTSVGYVNWDCGEPDGGGKEDAATIVLETGKWADNNLNHAYPYFCSRAPSPAPTGSPVPSGPVANATVGDTFFEFHATPLPLKEATQICENGSMTLATVSTQAENNLLHAILQNNTHDPYAYIGLHHESGDWRWVDGTSVNYSNWHCGEGESGHENVVICRKYGSWSDMNPALANPFFCSRRPSVEMPKAGSDGGNGNSETTYIILGSVLGSIVLLVFFCACLKLRPYKSRPGHEVKQPSGSEVKRTSSFVTDIVIDRTSSIPNLPSSISRHSLWHRNSSLRTEMSVEPRSSLCLCSLCWWEEETLVEMESKSLKSVKVEVFESRELQLKQILGIGAFGVSHLCTINRYGDKFFVLKIAKERKEVDGETVRELAALATLKHHPNIVPFIGVVFIKQKLCFLTEFCENGSLDRLHDKIDMTSQAKFLNIAVDVCCGLCHLHDGKIIHRDLAARNLVMKRDGMVLICDFGLARKLNPYNYYESRMRTKVPCAWTSPEALETGKYSPKSDIWSLGVAFWEILTKGHIPYNADLSAGMHIRDIVRQIIDGKTRLRAPSDACAPGRALVDACLVVDKAARYCIQAIWVVLTSITQSNSKGTVGDDNTIRGKAAMSPFGRRGCKGNRD
mmetsp:Transcript_29615/g.57734  ORF Transcript_29615/g.57734 Transcript_29615/m.57734 type:complete len:721 (+) Transcript_29615:199-2361(+)